MVPQPGTSLRSRVLVYHKDKNGFLHSLQNSDFFKRIVDQVSRGYPPTKPRVFSQRDRERMTQIGLKIRPMQLDFVVEIPWMQGALSPLWPKQVIWSFDVGTRSLSKILVAKGLQGCTIRENPNLGPGHGPYDNFIESLLAILDASTPARENLFEQLLESAADEADETEFNLVEKQGVRTVFHGTNHAVMDAILNSGLLPSFRYRGLREDYFGIDYRTSLFYTIINTRPTPKFFQLLVFMIIVEPANPVPSSGAVTVASNRFQLPMAEITLDN